eukprot:CAMPEP_0175589296 /NCGR_PEP_ID=MMETSP0096-20121207/51737_1 /TAXON_ID=311494 /ORGANISM="Alexandrium monilatum, Strain CCMP3105" /LENGTH=135 /DNA_ID=CAMNT_0016893311 /DNA_START=31 /DNA_END=435 /DNA_ORIENTATION=-
MAKACSGEVPRSDVEAESSRVPVLEPPRALRLGGCRRGLQRGGLQLQRVCGVVLNPPRQTPLLLLVVILEAQWLHKPEVSLLRHDHAEARVPLVGHEADDHSFIEILPAIIGTHPPPSSSPARSSSAAHARLRWP